MNSGMKFLITSLNSTEIQDLNSTSPCYLAHGRMNLQRQLALRDLRRVVGKCGGSRQGEGEQSCGKKTNQTIAGSRRAQYRKTIQKDSIQKAQYRKTWSTSRERIHQGNESSLLLLKLVKLLVRFGQGLFSTKQFFNQNFIWRVLCTNKQFCPLGTEKSYLLPFLRRLPNKQLVQVKCFPEWPNQSY